MDKPTGQENCKIAPTEFDEAIVDHSLEKGDEGQEGGQADDEADHLAVAGVQEGEVAEGGHCEAGGEQHGLETLGQQPVAVIEDEDVHNAGDEEEDVNINGEEVSVV